MNAKDWFDAGDKISDAVQEAVLNNDFGSLSKSIEDIVKQTMHTADTHAQYRAQENAYEAAKKKAGIKQDSNISKRDIKDIASMFFGYGTALVSGVTFLVMTVLAAVSGWGVFTLIAALFLIVTVAAVWLGHHGGSGRARNRRLKRYMHIIGDRDVITVRELADATAQKEAFVRSDLKQMINDGMFSSAVYMDRQETTLMMTRESYMQYLQTEKAFEDRRRQEKAERRMSGNEQEQQKARETAKMEAEKHLKEYPEETRRILKEGREFIDHIHEANEKIDDEEFSRKLDTLERVVTRIFDEVEKDPSSAPDLHRMMNYYLPITRKLVDAYAKIGDTVVPGGNADKTKQEISGSLDTINTAFENFLDSFFEDMEWDVSSDISVMKTMMARDGLTGGRDFVPGAHIETVARDVTGKDTQNPEKDDRETGKGTAVLSAGGGAAAAYEEKKS